MIEQEQTTIDRLSKEVTVDWPAVRAEVRLEAFEEVYKLFEGNAVEELR